MGIFLRHSPSIYLAMRALPFLTDKTGHEGFKKKHQCTYKFERTELAHGKKRISKSEFQKAPEDRWEEGKARASDECAMFIMSTYLF